MNGGSDDCRICENKHRRTGSGLRGAVEATQGRLSEQVSAVAAPREQLEAALDFVREGDSFIVTKIDRLARRVPHLCEIGAKLEAKGV